MLRNARILLMFCLILLFIFPNSFAGLTLFKHYTNSYVRSEFNAGNRDLFIGAKDVVAMKFSNDPVNSLGSQSPDVYDILTVFWVDKLTNRICWNMYNKNKNLFTFNTTTGLGSPSGICSDGKDFIYVTETKLNKVSKFRIIINNDGIHLSKVGEIGKLGNDNSSFKEPIGIACDAAGRVYVADYGNYRIQIFDSSFTYLATIGGTRGPGNYQFYGPTDITVLCGSVDTGSIFVVDRASARLVKYTAYPAMQFVTEMYSNNRRNIFYSYIDSDLLGNIYISTITNGNVYAFNNSLTSYSETDTGMGQRIGGLCVDKTRGGAFTTKGKLVVTGTNEIKIYNLGVTITQLNSNLGSDPLWINRNKRNCKRGDPKITYEVSEPGGNFRITDYSSSYEMQNYYSGSTGPGTGDVDYKIVKDSDGSIIKDGNHRIVMVITDGFGNKDMKEYIMPVHYDETGPTVYNLTVDSATSYDEGGGLRVTSQTIFHFNGGLDLDNTGELGCGLSSYEYRIGKGNNWTDWRRATLDHPYFHINESDGALADSSGFVQVQCRGIDELGSYGEINTFYKPIKIGWNTVPNMYADWAYKVSDSEIWLSGNSKDKYPVDCSPSCPPYNRLYPYKYYSDLILFNGSSFSFVALTNTAVVEQQDTDGTASPNEAFANRRFAFGFDFERYFLYNTWNKRGRLASYSGSLGAKSIDEGNPAANQQNSDVILNYYKNSYPSFKALITDTQGRVTAVDSSGSGTVLYGPDTGNPDMYPSTRIKYYNGYYYFTRSNGRIMRNANGGTPDLYTWTNEGPSRDITAAETINDVFFYADGTGWAVGTGGAIFRYAENVWTRNPEIVTSDDLNYIHMKDNEVGWIAGNNGVILTWDGNQSRWTYSNIGQNIKLRFITATKDTVLAGGALFKTVTEYNDNMENGILVRNFESNYTPVRRPIGLEAISDPGKITINWQPALPNDEYVIKGYNVYRAEYTTPAEIPDAAFVKVNTGLVYGTSYFESGGQLDANKNYMYAVSAVYGTATEDLGELYYSNEGFGTPKGSVWKTVGNDTYPLWDFPMGDPDAQRNVYTTTYKKIHGNFFAGNLWILKYDNTNNTWNNANIQHPYTLDTHKSETEKVMDFDVAENGVAVASVLKSDAFGSLKTWEFSNSNWHLAANDFNGSVYGSSPAFVFGGAENTWASAYVNGTAYTSMSKYVLNGQWEKYMNQPYVTGGYTNRLRLRNNNLLWITSNTSSHQCEILENGVMGFIPRDYDYFQLNKSPFGMTNSLHDYGIADMLSYDMYSQNANFNFLLSSQDLYNNGVFIKYSVDLATTAKMFMISHWDGTKWKSEYISSNLYRSDNNSMNFSSLARMGLKVDDNIGGITGMTRMIDNGTIVDEAHVLVKNPRTWLRSELPGLFDLYSLDEGQSAANDKTWIAGEYGQILEKRATAVVVPTPAAPTLTAANPLPTPFNFLYEPFFVNATWTQVAANSGNPEINGYNIYRQHDYGPMQYIGTTDKNTTHFFDDRFMTINGTYYYKLTAFDRYGNESDYSQESSVYINFLYTITYTVTSTSTPTPTYTATLTVTGTSTPTVTRTVTETRTFTVTPSGTVIYTGTITPTYTESPTHTDTFTVTETGSETRTCTASPTHSETATVTSTFTISDTVTETHTSSNTPSLTISPTFTVTETSCVNPDSSFGSNGYAHHDNAGGGDYIEDKGSNSVIGNDNMLYTIGTSSTIGQFAASKLILWRTDNAGNITMLYFYDSASGVDIAKDSHGNIWFAGRIYPSLNQSDIGLWKYTPGTGVSLVFVMDDVISDHTANSDSTDGIYIYRSPSDGHEKAVLAGSAFSYANAARTAYVLMYDIDTQAIDTAFGVNGVSVINSAVDSYANGITADKNGNVYIVGYKYMDVVTRFSDITVWKLDGSGNLQAGWPVIINNAGYDWGNAVITDPYGGIYVTGSVYNGTDDDMAVYKFDNNGNMLWGGPKIFDNGFYEYGTGFAIDICGGIIVSGDYTETPSNIPSMVMFKYDFDGTPDMLFGNGGNMVRYTAPSMGAITACKPVVYDNYSTSGLNYGRIVVTGGLSIFGVTNSFDMTLWRYMNDCGVCTPTNTPIITATNTKTITSTPTLTRTPALDEYEYDNEYTDANEIESGIEQTHSLAPAGDVDWVRFDVLLPSDVVIETLGSGEDDTQIWLYRLVDQLLEFVAMDDDGGQGYFSRIAAVLNTGTYYLKVKSFNPNVEIQTYYIDVLINPLPTLTMTATMTITETATPTASQTATLTITETDTETATQTVTGTGTATITDTYTFTPTFTATSTGTDTATGTVTMTGTATLTMTGTVTQTVTETVTVTGTRTASETASGTSSETATGTFSPTFTPVLTFTATCTRTVDMTTRLNLQVVNAGSNTCESWANLLNLKIRITNYGETPVDAGNLTVKMWVNSGSDVLVNGCWGGELRDSLGQWINTSVSCGITVDNNNPNPVCVEAADRKANRTVTFVISSSEDIPANGGYLSEINGQVYRTGWVSPFDDNCDDYSKPGSANYHNDVHFALYKNGVLVSEWVSASSPDELTGVEPCYTPQTTSTITKTRTNTPVQSPTVTLTPTYSSTVTFTASITATPSNTPTSTGTITRTITLTMTPTLTTTLTLTNTPSRTATSAISLNVTFRSGDANITTNSPHPNFKIYNTGTSAIALSSMEIRYWYRYDGAAQAEEAHKDYIGRSGTDIGSYTTLSLNQGTFGADQDRYLKVIFNSSAGSLGSGSGEFLEVLTRFNKTNWANYDQSNDWSFTTSTAYSSWNKVTVYIDGALVWGNEPGMGLLSVEKDILPLEEMSYDNVYSYPNPSAGETTIRFVSDGANDVVVLINDIDGKAVWKKVMKSSDIIRGINRLIWQGTDDFGREVANGVYLLTVMDGSKTVSKKIAIIK